VEVGIWLKVPQGILHRMLQDVQMKGGKTATQVGENEKAVVTALFMS
jgi:hypothetical protein